MLEAMKKALLGALHTRGYELINLRNDRETGFLLPAHLARVLKDLEINCVLDVGANRGGYARLLRRIGYKGHIVSFEPNKEVSQAISNEDPHWKIHNIALGSKNTTKKLNVSALTVMSSFLTKNEYQSTQPWDAPIIRTEDVEVRRLDSIFSELVLEIPKPRVFLKMDTQGYDLEVIRGAEGCLSTIVGLQSEISLLPIYEEMPGYLQALSEYQELGFHPTGFFTVTRDRRTLEVIEYDCVMVRSGIKSD